MGLHGVQGSGFDTNGAAIQKYSRHFDLLVSGFKNLLESLAEIKETDPAEHEKYERAVIGLLGKMSERL